MSVSNLKPSDDTKVLVLSMTIKRLFFSCNLLKLYSMSRTNAKQEFINLFNFSEIKCVEIIYNACCLWEMYGDDDAPPSKSIILKQNYSDQDLMNFLEQLDFNYDAGYGGQELYGIIWLKDGTWYTRGEYDGSEWWEYHCCPSIPEELKEHIEKQ